MEEKLNELTEQVKLLIDKVSNLESNSVSKKDLADQIKPLLNEIPSIRSEMISKNDLKVKVKTITGKDIDLYVKNTDKVIDLKSKLKEKEKISEGEQYLFLDEKLLEDNSTIAENKIKESSNLYLMKSDDEIFNFAKPQEKRFIVNALQKNLGKGIRTLLYSARKDGDDANTFHNKCDRNKDLLYLIKTTNNVFFYQFHTDH